MSWDDSSGIHLSPCILSVSAFRGLVVYMIMLLEGWRWAYLIWIGFILVDFSFTFASTSFVFINAMGMG